MPKGLKRYYGRDHLHFITFSCYRRLPLLGTPEARHLFVHALGKIRERYKFRLVGYVVMPEHVHLLISEPAQSTPSAVLQALKQRVSRDLRRNRGHVVPGQSTLSVPRDQAELPHFWQPRFHDFNVHSAGKRREKLDYMHANPIKRGLVRVPSAWVSSSWSLYAQGETGLIPVDPVPLTRARSTKVKNPTRKTDAWGTHQPRSCRPPISGPPGPATLTTAALPAAESDRVAVSG
jgi:putative transposase